MIWEFPLKTRSDDEVLSCIKHWVTTILLMYPSSHQLLHYHADGDAELINQRIKSYPLQTFATTGTSKLNSISESKVMTLGEMTLAMLADSGLPKSICWDGYVTARDIVRMMPTRTYRRCHLQSVCRVVRPRTYHVYNDWGVRLMC